MMSRILPILFVLIAIGLFFGYVNPTYTGDVAVIRAEIAGYDGALDAAKKFAEKKDELKRERNSIPQEGLDRIEAFLPDGVDNVQLILDLNSLASRSGITLSNFDMGVPEENTGDRLSLASEGATESLNLSVSATGSYAALKTFLKGAEWSLRPMDLIDLSLGESKTGVYTYDMTFRIYWLR